MSYITRYLMADFADRDWRRMPLASWYLQALARPIRRRRPDTMLARPLRVLSTNPTGHPQRRKKAA